MCLYIKLNDAILIVQGGNATYGLPLTFIDTEVISVLMAPARLTVSRGFGNASFSVSLASKPTAAVSGVLSQLPYLTSLNPARLSDASVPSVVLGVTSLSWTVATWDTTKVISVFVPTVRGSNRPFKYAYNAPCIDVVVIVKLKLQWSMPYCLW